MGVLNILTAAKQIFIGKRGNKVDNSTVGCLRLFSIVRGRVQWRYTEFSSCLSVGIR